VAARQSTDTTRFWTTCRHGRADEEKVAIIMQMMGDSLLTGRWGRRNAGITALDGIDLGARLLLIS
jgi:hypothetical protein